NFYGTTVAGGAHDQGTAFEITPAGALSVMHSFSGSPSEGAGPVAGLVQGTDGNFYGTTALGGANSKGTLFKLSSSSISNN
ncbi:MAG: choice-of-anchor tandem repeat GloVer-containing protein, partial [Candidatus Udaeobacter sp.]